MAEQPERFAVPVSSEELIALTAAVAFLANGSEPSMQAMAERQVRQETLQRVLEHLKAVEQFVQARQKLAELGLLGEHASVPAR